MSEDPRWSLRGRIGVVCSVLEDPAGKVRVVFDDAIAQGASFPQEWKSHTPFTALEFDKDGFLRSELSDEELADVGLNIVARLAALHLQASRSR
jgi:hypothetical protein